MVSVVGPLSGSPNLRHGSSRSAGGDASQGPQTKIEYVTLII